MPMIRVAVLAPTMLVSVLVAAVLTASCGGPATSGTAASGAATSGTASASAMPPASTSAGPTTGAPAAAVPEQLRFTATTVDGVAFDAASLAGRPAVLWFWAPWCPICNAEAPELRDIAQANAGAVTFVGVAGLDQVAAMRGFVDKHSLGSFVHLADTDGALWRRFGVTHQPAYAFIGADGTVRVQKTVLSKGELANAVAVLTGR